MFGLPIWAIRVIGYAALVLVIFAAGARIMSQLDAGKIATYKATIATGKAQVAQVAAVTKTITVKDQAAEHVAQAAITGQHAVITKEIIRYVSSSPSPPVGCVTWGMLRLHDAAVLGVNPGDLGDPAAEPDDQCSPVAPSVFMATVNDNYTAARANAEQLDALIADVESRAAALSAASGPGVAAPLKLPALHL